MLTETDAVLMAQKQTIEQRARLAARVDQQRARQAEVSAQARAEGDASTDKPTAS